MGISFYGIVVHKFVIRRDNAASDDLVPALLGKNYVALFHFVGHLPDGK